MFRSINQGHPRKSQRPEIGAIAVVQKLLADHDKQDEKESELDNKHDDIVRVAPPPTFCFLGFEFRYKSALLARAKRRQGTGGSVAQRVA